MQGSTGGPWSGAPTPTQQELEAVERELHELAQEHARLRGEIEEGFARVREIEERFLALRPQADPTTQRELKRRMVLSRPWREELERAYQGLLVSTNQIGIITRRIHEAQLRAAQLAASSGGPELGGPGLRGA